MNTDNTIQAQTKEEIIARFRTLEAKVMAESKDPVHRSLVTAKMDMSVRIFELFDELLSKHRMDDEEATLACAHTMLSVLKIFIPLAGQTDVDFVPKLFEAFGKMFGHELHEAAKDYVLLHHKDKFN